MVTNDALRMTVVKVFDACAHTIYIAKILWAKKLCIRKRSVYEPYWAVIVVRYPIIGLGLSAFNYQTIHICRISLTPYPNLHPHTIRFGLSTSARISKTLLHIRIIRIRIGCGNYPHHFHPYQEVTGKRHLRMRYTVSYYGQNVTSS
jgi:hypothetical protein